MNPSNIAKVLAAFVAGVVLTLGVLMYSRTHELTQPRTAVQTAPCSLASAPGELSTAPMIGPEDIKASGTPFQAIEGTSNRRMPAQVPEPAVPARVPQSDPVRDRGSELAQATALSSAAKTIPPVTAPVSTAEPNPVPAERQQSSNMEPAPVPRKPKLITLQPGTSLAIRLEESVSTERSRRGDTFRAALDSPLIVNGFVLADRGARVLGQIEGVRKARLLRGQPDLKLRLTEITLKDGQRLSIETSPWEEKGARSSSIRETPKRAAGIALGAVVGALTETAKGAGFVSDESGERKRTVSSANKRILAVARGARLTFQIATPVTVTERLNYAETRH